MEYDQMFLCLLVLWNEKKRMHSWWRLCVSARVCAYRYVCETLLVNSMSKEKRFWRISYLEHRSPTLKERTIPLCLVDIIWGQGLKNVGSTISEDSENAYFPHVVYRMIILESTTLLVLMVVKPSLTPTEVNRLKPCLHITSSRET